MLLPHWRVMLGWNECQTEQRHVQQINRDLLRRTARPYIGVIKSRTRPHRLMTGVPSTAEDPARPGRGSEAAPQCRSLQGWAQATLASAAPEPALIVAERKKRLEFLDGETIANRRSWIWLDETVRFFFGVRAQPRFVTALSRECGAKIGALVVIHPFCGLF